MVAWVQNGCKCVGCLPSCYMTDWVLWFAATAQNHKTVPSCIMLAQEKIKIQSMVSIEC